MRLVAGRRSARRAETLWWLSLKKLGVALSDYFQFVAKEFAFTVAGPVEFYIPPLFQAQIGVLPLSGFHVQLTPPPTPERPAPTVGTITRHRHARAPHFVDEATELADLAHNLHHPLREFAEDYLAWASRFSADDNATDPEPASEAGVDSDDDPGSDANSVEPLDLIDE